MTKGYKYNTGRKHSPNTTHTRTLTHDIMSEISAAPQPNIFQSLWNGVTGFLAPGSGNLNIPSSNLSPSQVSNAIMSNLTPQAYASGGAPVSPAAKTVVKQATTAGRVLGQTAPTPTPTPPPPTGGGGGGNPGPDLSNPVKKTEYAQSQGFNSYEEMVNAAGKSSNDAAAAAAEARRGAAQRAYEGKVNAAGVAKGAAQGQYDWLVGSLGSNKKDLLDQVALNDTTGSQDYATQQAQTQKKYDESKKEILSTYRDLGREQEKIMRGAGVSSSSRSMEAQLRLNNLMGKDLGALTTNEADSMAMIGNALAAFKGKVQLTKNSIETDTKNNLDKASLDYNTQVKAIDANLQLSANEREDAYAAADAQLAADTASIEKWAAGTKLQVQMTLAQQKGTLDNFITDMTDSAKLLGSDIATKTAATDQVVNQISTAVTLDAEGKLTMPTGNGGKTKAKSQNLASLYDPGGVGLAGTAASSAGAGAPGTVQNLTSAQSDPMLSALFATG